MADQLEYRIMVVDMPEEANGKVLMPPPGFRLHSIIPTAYTGELYSANPDAGTPAREVRRSNQVLVVFEGGGQMRSVLIPTKGWPH